MCFFRRRTIDLGQALCLWCSGELRCTCPHPPPDNIGRAGLVPARPAPHLTLTIHPSTFPPIIFIDSDLDTLDSRRIRFQGQHTLFILKRCCPSAAPSFISQPVYNPPRFHYAQVCHPSYSIRDPEHRVQQV
ncbi:hypothetical protein GCK32_019024, partial [Trichostrongylus colubriformis]